MGKDKRKAERMASALFANLQTLTNQELGRGVVLDVSLTGFGIETEAELQSNQEINCYMEIPLVVRAKVIRKNVQGQIKRYGLQFVGQGFFDKLVMKKVLSGSRNTKKV